MLAVLCPYACAGHLKAVHGRHVMLVCGGEKRDFVLCGASQMLLLPLSGVLLGVACSCKACNAVQNKELRSTVDGAVSPAG